LIFLLLIHSTTRQNDSPSLFDSIPDEVLAEILEWLSFHQMKDCCLVSQRFNEVISRSKGFLKKTYAVLNLKDDLNLQGRKYQKYRIEGKKMSPLNSNIFQQLSELGNHIKVLEMYDTDLEEKSFAEFLKSCNNLEEIKFEYCSAKKNQDRSQIASADLMKLKKLTITGIQSHWILKHLNADNLGFFEISADSESYYQGYRGQPYLHIFISFLNKLKNLKTLVLSKINLESGRLQPQFKWKELKLDEIELIDEDVDRLPKNYIELIKSADKGAKISLSGECDSELLELLLKKANENRNIDTFGAYLGALEYFDIALNNISGIKSLELNAEPMSEPDNRVAKLSRIFPGVETLIVDAFAIMYLERHFNCNFSNVKHLKMEILMPHMPLANLPNLEIFEVDNFILEDAEVLVRSANSYGVSTVIAHVRVNKAEDVFNELQTLLSSIHKVEVIDSKTGITYQRIQND
jgi:hypothetical protein